MEDLTQRILQSIQTSVVQIDERLGRLEHRLGSLETHLGALVQAYAVHNADYDALRSRVERIEKRLQLVDEN